MKGDVTFHIQIMSFKFDLVKLPEKRLVYIVEIGDDIDDVLDNANILMDDVLDKGREDKDANRYFFEMNFFQENKNQVSLAMYAEVNSGFYGPAGAKIIHAKEGYYVQTTISSFKDIDYQKLNEELKRYREEQNLKPSFSLIVGLATPAVSKAKEYKLYFPVNNRNI